MPFRLGQFYASLLLLVCLGTNIAFFSEVREPFLGSEDPLASFKTALADLNIKERIGELYRKVQPEKKEQPTIDAVPKSSVIPPVQLEKSKEESAPKPELQQESATKGDPFGEIGPLPSPPVEPFFQPPMPPLAAAGEFQSKDLELTEYERTTPLAPVLQTAAIQPVVAENFKVVSPLPMPVKFSQPSASPVWDNIDTALERPLRYD